MAQEEKNWERETLEKLAFAALKEQTRARRWGIFFKLFIQIGNIKRGRHAGKKVFVTGNHSSAVSRPK